MRTAAMDAASGAPPQAALTKSSEESGGSGDYSKTNIQVEGVDEADIVKNDGKYIYAVSGGTFLLLMLIRQKGQNLFHNKI